MADDHWHEMALVRPAEVGNALRPPLYRCVVCGFECSERHPTQIVELPEEGEDA